MYIAKSFLAQYSYTIFRVIFLLTFFNFKIALIFLFGFHNRFDFKVDLYLFPFLLCCKWVVFKLYPSKFLVCTVSTISKNILEFWRRIMK